MAIFKISSSGVAGSTPSVNSSSFDGFDFDTIAADTLIVDADAYLISTTVDGVPQAVGIGARLGNLGGAWTATIAGQVFGSYTGMDIRSATATVTVTEDGTVRGGSDLGIDFIGGGSFTLTNKGTIIGGFGTAILMSAATSSLTNSGDIFGGITQNTQRQQ